MLRAQSNQRHPGSLRVAWVNGPAISGQVSAYSGRTRNFAVMKIMWLRLLGHELLRLGQAASRSGYPEGCHALDSLEHMFENGGMLDVAVRRLDGSTAVDLTRRVAPALPIHPALSPLLPDGIRRGSTVSVSGSVSLLLALISAASAEGAWCALVGLPTISAEAAAEYGLDLQRLAIVPQPGASWTTAVGALLDAVDIVALRPPARVVPGDVRRLAARARNR